MLLELHHFPLRRCKKLRNLKVEWTEIKLSDEALEQGKTQGQRKWNKCLLFSLIPVALKTIKATYAHSSKIIHLFWPCANPGTLYHVYKSCSYNLMRHLPEFTFGEKVVKSQILNDRHALTFGTSCLQLQIQNKISNRRHGRGEHF